MYVGGGGGGGGRLQFSSPKNQIHEVKYGQEFVVQVILSGIWTNFPHFMWEVAFIREGVFNRINMVIMTVLFCTNLTKMNMYFGLVYCCCTCLYLMKITITLLVWLSCRLWNLVQTKGSYSSKYQNQQSHIYLSLPSNQTTCKHQGKLIRIKCFNSLLLW